jgi:hypothetical protein
VSFIVVLVNAGLITSSFRRSTPALVPVTVPLIFVAEETFPMNSAFVPLTVTLPGRLEIRAPVHAGRIAVEVGALPWVVLLEHVSGIGIWRMGLRDPRFKRQNTLGLGVRCRNLCQLQNRRDMCPILLT